MPAAVNLLRQFANDRDFVFVGGRIGRPIANVQAWLVKLRQRAALADFRFHDLRRTVASGMSAIGIPRLTISKLLNHTEGGVTRIYDRHSYDSEKRQALLRWERHLTKIVSGASNVIELHALGR